MSTKTNDGGPAFPVCYQHENLETGEKEVTAAFHGMSLRDWFLGNALSGLLASGRLVSDELMRDASTVADLAIAAREKGAK